MKYYIVELRHNLLGMLRSWVVRTEVSAVLLLLGPFYYHHTLWLV